MQKYDRGTGSAWKVRQDAIRAAARAAKVPRGAMALLRVLLEAEDGRTQTVIRARETLADAMGAHIDTVDRNMKVLVAAGAVEKLYSKGGQHKANCYKLKVISGYHPQNAECNGIAPDYLPQNADLPPAKCGNTSRKMHHPSYSSYLSERERSGASRPATPPHGGSALADSDQLERDAFRQAMRACSGDLDLASAWMAAWREERAGNCAE